MINVPFIDLKREAAFFESELISITKEVIRSGIYINGENVLRLEKHLADYCGTKYCISVGNGSDAIELVMRSLGISMGEEVICPANSFIASAWAISAVGAKPVFADVEDNLLMTLNDIKKCVSKQTRAVLTVHLTGKLSDVESIKEFCDEKNILLIEDAAQAIGAKDESGKKAGNFGIAGCFSLHPLKNLSIYGDGGFVTTNSEDLANDLKVLRNHGLINRDEASKWGFNSRLDELQAAYALIKLKKIEYLTEKYIEIARFYSKNINDKILKPSTRKGCRDVFHNYVIRVPQKHRDLIMETLLINGVETKIHYPIPLHLQKCSSNLNYKVGDIPNAEMFAKSMISLPIHPFLSIQEMTHVCDTLNNVFKDICG
tara:strand:- start:2444 stop:3562 length:1119 start_codon:yes stop_codon:yes gene_type:complete